MGESVVSPVLAAAALTVVVMSLAVLVAVGSPGAYALRGAVDRYGSWAAFAIAGTATAGSLYYSEVAHFTPCLFCWYQRIAMYPLAVVLLVGSIARDRNVWRYVVPIAAIGLLLSLYHYQLEMFPEQATACSSGVPCNVRLVEEFGFISLAFMAGCGFLSILALFGATLRVRNRAA